MALPPPKLDKRTTDKLNLQVLQRVDPDVEEVLVTAGHVALYHLDVPKMQWGRKDVEGSLFVVKRRTQPRFQFIVLNQRSTANLVQDILDEFRCELTMPYLFYRSNDAVNGIWFFSGQECMEVASLIQRIQSMFSTTPSQENRSIITMPTQPPASDPATVVSESHPAPRAPESPPTPETLSPHRGVPLNVGVLLGQGAAGSISPPAAGVVVAATAASVDTGSQLPASAPAPAPSSERAPAAAASASTPTNAPPAGTALPQLLSPSFFLASGGAVGTGAGAIAEPTPPSREILNAPADPHRRADVAAAASAAPPAPELMLMPPQGPAFGGPAAPTMRTAAMLEKQLTEGAVLAEIESKAGPHPPLTRDTVRQALVSLVQDDSFVDMFAAALSRASLSAPKG